MANAQSIRCSRCGASVEITTAALVAPCTSCGHAEPVPPELVAELRSYEAQHAASLALAVRRASLRALRAERSVVLRLRRATVSPLKPIVGSFGAITVLGIGGSLVGSFVEGEPLSLPVLSRFCCSPSCFHFSSISRGGTPR